MSYVRRSTFHPCWKDSLAAVAEGYLERSPGFAFIARSKRALLSAIRFVDSECVIVERLHLAADVKVRPLRIATHIVDDVSALCARVAIMAAGRMLRVGEPRALMAELDGRLWSTAVDKTEAERLRLKLSVVSTRIVAGRTEVRLLADAALPGMQSATPTLEDVYFATLLEHGIDTAAEQLAMRAFIEVFRFECRYRLKSPLYLAVSALFLTS